MKIESMEELFLAQIEDLYDAEKRLVKALPKMAEAGKLHAFRHDGFWQCMDNLREVEVLNKLWEKGDAPWKVW